MASRAGYVLAAICLAAGLAVAVWIGLAAFQSLQHALTRVVVPGSSVLTLDEPGTYTIFHEADSVVDGKLYSAPAIPGLRVTVTAEDGTPIAVSVPTISSSYTIGSHSGKSVLAFDIATPGRYRFSAGYANGSSGPQTVLAIGRGFFGRLFGAVAGAIGSIFLGFGAGLALALTTYFRRRRMARGGLPAAF